MPSPRATGASPQPHGRRLRTSTGGILLLDVNPPQPCRGIHRSPEPWCDWGLSATSTHYSANFGAGFRSADAHRCSSGSCDRRPERRGHGQESTSVPVHLGRRHGRTLRRSSPSPPGTGSRSAWPTDSFRSRKPARVMGIRRAALTCRLRPHHVGSAPPSGAGEADRHPHNVTADRWVQRGHTLVRASDALPTCISLGAWGGD